MTALSAATASDPAENQAGSGPAAVALAAIALLDQCEGFIRQLAGGPAYAAASRAMPGGTLGKHVRHSLDHFRAVLDGAHLTQVIDYDSRARNVPMETLPEEALTAIAALRERLGCVHAGAVDQPVRVRVMLTGDGQSAELCSTLGRELAFATHHAVHHHAMMGVIAGEFGQRPPTDFGKAPSTISYERRQG
jgi:uncharacterized damage-inducible protein DinB